MSPLGQLVPGTGALLGLFRAGTAAENAAEALKSSPSEAAFTAVAGVSAPNQADDRSCGPKPSSRTRVRGGRSPLFPAVPLAPTNAPAWQASTQRRAFALGPTDKPLTALFEISV